MRGRAQMLILQHSEYIAEYNYTASGKRGRYTIGVNFIKY